MWFKLLIIFQLQLYLQLQVPILSSYSYSYSYFYLSVTLDSYSLTAEHQSLPKQQLVHIRTTTSLHKNIVQSQQETGAGSREAGNNRKTP